ncbi:MAG: hypothetical protein F4X97_09895 [Boseongicola sp. SB0662_bin_57]|nr:hypothetical protein [Boseongicola sp. SB0662_bin_57]
MTKALDGWFDVARPGTFTDARGKEVELTEAWLRRLAAAYDPDEPAPVVVGHPPLDAPAYGWIKGLRMSGDRLQAKVFKVMPEFRVAVEAGRYAGRSLAILGDRIRHLGFLGGRAPAIPGLKPAQFAAPETGVTMLCAPTLDREVIASRAVADGASKFTTMTLLQFAGGVAFDDTEIGRELKAVDAMVKRIHEKMNAALAEDLAYRARRLAEWSGREAADNSKMAVQYLTDADKAMKAIRALANTGNGTAAQKVVDELDGHVWGWSILTGEMDTPYKGKNWVPTYKDAALGSGATFAEIVWRDRRGAGRHDLAGPDGNGRDVSDQAIANHATMLIRKALPLSVELTPAQAVDIARFEFGVAPLPDQMRNLSVMLAAREAQADAAERGETLDARQAVAVFASSDASGDGRPSNQAIAHEARRLIHLAERKGSKLATPVAVDMARARHGLGRDDPPRPATPDEETRRAELAERRRAEAAGPSSEAIAREAAELVAEAFAAGVALSTPAAVDRVRARHGLPA